MKSQKASLEWFYKATCNNMVPVTVGTEKLEDIKEDKWQCLTSDFLID